MKISYNWLIGILKEKVEIEKLSKILTDTGLEVDGYEALEGVKGGLRNVVVGEVLTCEKHPDADKLKITTVNIGNEILQIVCGAPNVIAGQKVMVATIGTQLFVGEESFKIKKSKIRGIESLGMLCSEVELGLGDSHDGIMVLDGSALPGTPAADYFQLESDYQIEIGLTPNRADAMGVIGVARDVAAYLNFHEGKELDLSLPKYDVLNTISNDKKEISVTVEKKDLCPRYVGVSMNNIKVSESPKWLQNKLRSAGLVPINNIVDATNYVMRELGTPLHAFDYNIVNGSIMIRTASENEKITTLDGIERNLSTDDLVIANKEMVLAIAGVFGGLNSGINNETTSIFIESAYFNPISVRKTAKRHGLNTDASFRYERGVDPSLTKYALEKVVALIQEIAGGEIAMQYIDTNPNLAKGKNIKFKPENCNRLIGTNISSEEMIKILKSLDIEIIDPKNDIWELKVPDYRVDVTREVDIIEEILRIYGFNNVEIPEQLHSVISYSKKPDLDKIKNTILNQLVSNGFFETMNNSLTTSAYVEKLGNDILKSENNVELLNPLSQDLNVMRQSLLFSNLEVIVHNQNRQNPNLKTFEFGKTYANYNGRYVETSKLLISVTGNKNVEQWNTIYEKSSYYTIKGIVKAIFEKVGLWKNIETKNISKSLLNSGEELYIGKQKIAEIGKVSKKMNDYFGIKNDVFVADINWDLLCSLLKSDNTKYAELPKTFEVRRDFSLLLDKKVTFKEIEKIAESSDNKILKRVNLFDVYEGKNLEEGKKSYAVAFYFQDKETLKDEQVDAVMTKIRSKLESELGAQLR